MKALSILLILFVILFGLVSVAVGAEYLAEKGYSWVLGIIALLVMFVGVLVKFKKKMKFSNLTRRHE